MKYRHTARHFVRLRGNEIIRVGFDENSEEVQLECGYQDGPILMLVFDEEAVRATASALRESLSHFSNSSD